MTGGETS